MERQFSSQQQSNKKNATNQPRRVASGPGSSTQFYLQDLRPKSVVQKKQTDDAGSGTAPQAGSLGNADRSGLPAQLKAGVENLSGYSMDDVKVHYNSAKPAQLQAHAYAQGTEIHLAAGQEKHLPHEAWHVAQQKQGRVKPTLQMKSGASLNDDKGLEGEADVMGAKALNSGNGSNRNLLKSASFGNIAQRVIKAGSFKALLAEQDVLEGAVAVANARATELSVPLEKALPEFDRNKLYDVISRKGLNIRGIEVAPALVGHFIEQKKSEVEGYAFPESDWDEFADWLREKVGDKLVTAGFEFEFSSMVEDNPFAGVTHVELSKSQQIINKLPFVLETDAGNALELVTPPFFLEAIDSEIPLPKPEDAEKVESLIKARLGEIATAGGTMKTMAEAFAADPGLTFHLPEAKVTPKSLSDRSFGKFTAGKDTVSAEELENIGVGKITKYGHGGIDTQINIATDAASYAAFIDLEIKNREKNIYVKQFYTLQKALEDGIGIRKFEEPLKGFLRLFVRNIAGQLAVPSMEKIFEKQQEAFTTGKSEKKKGELDFDFYAWASSGVKDIGNIWIKDNIINIGIGMLNKADWTEVFEIIKSNQLQHAITQYQVPAYLTDAVSDKLDAKAADMEIAANRKTFGAYYIEAKVHMLSATNTLGKAIISLKLNEEESDKMIPTLAVPFMKHNANYINPRQDTHLPPDKVQLPAWKQRLHVSEIRSNPIEGLKAWASAAVGNKAFKEKQRVNAEKYEKTALPYQRYNDLLNSDELKGNEIKIISKFEKNIGLKIDEYEIIKKRLGNMNEKQRAKVMEEAKGLAWGDTYTHVSKALAHDKKFAEFD